MKLTFSLPVLGIVYLYLIEPTLQAVVFILVAWAALLFMFDLIGQIVVVLLVGLQY